jgi:hypothetical protein
LIDVEFVSSQVAKVIAERPQNASADSLSHGGRSIRHGLVARGRIVRARVVGDDLPPKEGAHLPKRVRLGVAKHDDVLGIEGDDKLSAVALKCYQPSRSLDVRGQLNLFNHTASISVLTAPERPVEIVR